MFIALDKTHNRIWAEDAVHGGEYVCSVCRGKVFLKAGEKVAWHFAHKKGAPCNDNWKYDMSLWRKKWLDKFDESRREVVLSCNSGIHRADICIGKYVVLFQKEKISEKAVAERNQFYTECGYRVLWVFNLSECEENISPAHSNIPGVSVKNRSYQWKKSLRCLRSILPQENPDVQVCFQFSEAEDFLNQVIDTDYADYRNFTVTCCNAGIFTEEELDQIFETGEKIQNEKKIFDEAIELTEEKARAGLYDPLTKYVGKNGENRVYPCFRDNNPRRSVTDCGDCVYGTWIDFKDVCTYRFCNTEHQNISGLHRDENGYIYGIQYENGESSDIARVKALWRTIPELFEIYKDMNVARLKNESTGAYVEIKKDFVKEFKKSGKIMGRFCRDGLNYSSYYDHIFDGNEPEWRVIWFSR